ncbi:MAG: aminotransferase class III-fold pyridoxal phosphate-dependent enzyme [Planctomycetes bacterium]|nr:aminotransferase class III-fold pyridoxal phosphate-dependent enzyme [Planctomycetota bacterium]
MTHAPTRTEPADYGRFARPHLMRVLEACRLDAVYHRAEGDLLWTRDARGAEVEVLDMAGGYGVGLLGHHHPAVAGALRAALDERAPFHAQGSHRVAAGALCRRLSDLVGAYSGRRYVVTLGNTGAEAVEAAIKHAELERDRRVQDIVEGHREHHRAIQGKLRNRQCDVVPRVLAEVGARLGMPAGSEPDLEEVFHQVLVHNTRLAEEPPLFLALEGAFHGKTTGSLKLTWSPEARRPFRRLGVEVVFLPRGDVGALAERVREARQTYLDLVISDEGHVRLQERPISRVAALFAEPLQGEGGVHEVGAAWLLAAQEAAREAGFPLVLDEVQTGCGRTGTFLASEQDGVVADYYVLSKALGGGLAKVSALLVDSARYREEFGTLHTSTFAEDDLSSRVALAALDVITGEDDALGRARRQGERLRAGLLALRARFPRQVVDVRGRGLMIGLELARRDDAESPTLRQLASQGLLGFVVAGFLLDEERVRVLPTLSRPETLRIQPSAFVTDAQVDRFLAAVERALALLEHDRGDRLIRYLCADATGAAPRPADASRSGTGPIVRAATRPRRATSVPPYAGRVSFLAHFIRAGHLRHWDPGLGGFDDAALERYLDRTHRLLDPFVSEAAIVESAIGERVHLSLVGVPVTPTQIQRAFDEGSVRWVEDKVLAGVRLARRQGSSIVGLGGYTSIITGQGTRISEDRVGITSGNAMTVAAGVEALVGAAEEAGIDLSTACLGALGATGNICSLYAQMMADRVPRLVLVGRPHMEPRLRRVAGEVYFETYKLLRREPDRPPTGVGRVLAPTETYRRVRAAEDDLERIGLAIVEGLERELGDEAPVQVRTDPVGLRACDLIVSASSTPDPVIYPRHLGPGPRVICDLAVPEDTAPEVLRERPDVRVLRGGIVRLPRPQGLVLAGLPLEPDHVFACMAETLLLGLSRMNEHFSWGRVTKMHVEAIRDLAAYHGFTLARPALESPL